MTHALTTERPVPCARAGRRFAATVLALLGCALAPAPRAAAQDAPAGQVAATVAAVQLGLPERPEAGRTYPLRLAAGNRAARVTVHNVAAVDTYGSHKAPPGRTLLVVSTEWENVIPLTVIDEQKIPTTYKIPNLADHVYLVLDGRRLARLDGAAATLPGHVPVKDFSLEHIGSRVRGNLVFALPAGGVTGTAELRFYDFAHGHFVVPLSTPAVVAAAAAAPPPAPVSPAQKNEVVEVAPFAVRKLAELNGRAAPQGMQFVAVDLRARSTFTVDADATAFDPKARPGAKTKLGYVADWKESRRYLQLVADGEYAFMPEAETDLEEEPRFLPDVMTGGSVVFVAPKEVKSLELRCDFPNARASTGAAFRPKGMTLALEGKRPQPENPKAIASVDDENYRVQVVGQSVVAERGGSVAGAERGAGGSGAGGELVRNGQVFLVLDVVVQNRGWRNGEFFQTSKQLKYVSETGGQVEMSPVSFEGPRRAAELVWIPPGERRRFEAVFEIGEGEKRPRVAFNGVTKAEVLTLKPIDAAAVAAKKPAGAAPITPANAQPQQPAKVAANDNAAKPAAPMTTPPQKPATPTPAPQPPAKEIKPLRVAAKQPHEPKGLAGVGLTPEQVNAAIDRGAEALWAVKKAEMKRSGVVFGAKLGYDVLVALALVHADYHRKSPEFDAELRGMLSRIEPEDLGTYGAGCFIMLIEAYGDGYYVPQLRRATRCLLESQGPEGSWGYTARAPEAALRDPQSDRVLQIRGGLPLEGEGALGTPMQRATKYDKTYDGDNSTSQYALLGLWSSTKAKVPVDAETWKRALAVTRARQCDDGGWNYTTPSYSYGSMTCAGVCAIALARHHLGEAAPAADEAIERGLAWLTNNFTVTKHPAGSDQYLFYYLYSLERVGRILDTEFIGPHEWYPIGARWLLDNQKGDGIWGGGNYEDPEVATPFALLFLTRATSTLNPEQKRGGDGKLRTDVAVAPGHRVYIILDCSGSMLPEIDGKPKFEIAREAVASLVESLPDNAEVALRVYGHRRHARMEDADQDTELIVQMNKLDRRAFGSKLAALRPRGKTPLALSLREAAKDLSGFARDEKKPVTVVLLTDGGEDTRPRQDPLAAADEIAKLPGINLQVVGFDINREDWTEQLQGIARRGKGQYLTAAKADALLRELKSAVFRVPDTFFVTTAKGQPVFQSTFGTEKALPEGKYQFTTNYGGRKYSEPFWINTEATTAIVFDASKVGTDRSGAVADAGADTAPAPAPTKPAPAGAKKFCTSCGKPLTGAVKFCPHCGAKVDG